MASRLVSADAEAAVAEAAIVADGLTRRYPGGQAVCDVRFQVGQGELFAFLGPNGAGKSTTISMLCTLERPSAGRAWVAGHDVARAPLEVRRRIGLVFQDSTLDAELTGLENLRLHADLYGMPRARARRRIDDMLELVDLADRAREAVRRYSGGMRRRLEVARALLHGPRVLFLDEPTLGLDPRTRAQVWRYVRGLSASEGVTVFVTTHYLDEAEHCDRLAIIDRGRLVTVGQPAELKAAIGADRIELRTGDDALVELTLRQRFGVRVDRDRDRLVLWAADGAAFVPRMCAALDVPVLAVSVTRPSLDDVFLHHTGRGIQDEPTAAGPPGLALARAAG